MKAMVLPAWGQRTCLPYHAPDHKGSAPDHKDSTTISKLDAV